MSQVAHTTDRGSLNPAQFEAAWDRLTMEALDVLVVGCGVTGSGVALDAATRGLRVGLVEARDVASGTSSRSSKLFHGGLRYLEMMDFGLVREALHERDLMLTKLAPHLVTPVPFLYPLKHRGWERAYVGAGLMLYDALAGRSPLPRHRHLTRQQALRQSPALRRTTLTGALRYYDAVTDDARHTLTLARTSAAYGAIVRTSTEVTGLVMEDGRVVGAHLRDVETDRTGMARAKVVIGCTGVWSDFLHNMAGVRSPFQVRASKGVHIVVPRDRIQSDTGLIIRTEKSVLFVIPWGEQWVVGTTDTPWDLSLEHPAASRADIDHILGCVNKVLAHPLTSEDIVGVYVGLRPLLAPTKANVESTSKLSREHQVARPLPGLVTVAGGKYTTYRVMAKDAIDIASQDLQAQVPGSVTEDVPLLGAAGFAATLNSATTLADRFGVPKEAIVRMTSRYGDLVEQVLDPAVADASLVHPVPGAPRYLMAEIRYAVTHEGALHLDDLLARRTRISVDTVHRGVESAQAVADLVAPLLGWGPNDIRDEVESYRKRVEHERAAHQLPSDKAAQTRRSEAPDPRSLATPDRTS